MGRDCHHVACNERVFSVGDGISKSLSPDAWQKFSLDGLRIPGPWISEVKRSKVN